LRSAARTGSLQLVFVSTYYYLSARWSTRGRRLIHTQREGASNAYQALQIVAQRLEPANLTTANYGIFEAEEAVSKIATLLVGPQAPPQEVEAALEVYHHDPQSWAQLLRD
jgi:hypothetical protein